MQYRDDKGCTRYAFDSLAEIAKYIETTPRTWRTNASVTETKSRDWDLRAGYDKAWHMARFGWPEGAQQAQRALKVLDAATPAPIDKVDFYGHRPHVPRYCAGAPDSMIRRAKPTSGGDNVLTLYVPVNALAGVSAVHMSNFGLAVAQYVRQLELGGGKRMELHGAICSTVNGTRLSHTWRIKRADQQLDLAVLAFSIGHPAMFRRIGFALRERSSVPYKGAYGSTVPLEMRDIINPPAGAKILNGMGIADSVARTVPEAVEYISKQISNTK